MKTRLLLFIIAISFFVPASVKAQTSATFNIQADTVQSTFVKTGSPGDNITNVTGNNIVVKWHVTATDFPADWLTGPAFGICDNYSCRPNASSVLWNPSTASGYSFYSTYHSNSAHDSIGSFGLSLDLSNATSIGTHWVTISVSDTGAATTTSRTMTYVINKLVNGVPNITNGDGNITLYPNPASNELNVVYDANADVKNIAVYNIIGKVMTVYKVTGDSANLNLENIPSGIYFVRLFNSNGNVVVTRKFTKQ